MQDTYLNSNSNKFAKIRTFDDYLRESDGGNSRTSVHTGWFFSQ